MRVVAIVQARTGSTRLPGKVLLDIAGEPMLARVMTRAGRASLLEGLIVATTTRSADDPIVDLCMRRGWPWFRGSESDLLDRYYHAALQSRADAVVRILSDCPLVDPTLIDLVIGTFLTQPPVDYVSLGLPPRTFPRGLDVEVMSMSALARAWREDDSAARREHVSPYIFRNPDKFRMRAVTHDHDYSWMRWTVDVEEDLRLVRLVYEHFGHDAFSWLDVIAALDRHPEWLAINRDVQQKPTPA